MSLNAPNLGFWRSAQKNLAYSPRLTWRQGYTLYDLLADALAGLVVGLVALPLSLALALASGVSPEHGLSAAIVVGAVTALFGGAPKQVTGPSAALLVLCAPLVAQFGLGGLAIASVMAGIWLVLLGLLRLGALIDLVPVPVRSGSTGGIAVIIATLQLKDLLGLTMASVPEGYFDLLGAVLRALPTLRLADALMGVGTLVALLVAPRFLLRIPMPLVALAFASCASFVLNDRWPTFSVSTLHSRLIHLEGGVRRAGVVHSSLWPSFNWFTQGAHNSTLSFDWSLFRVLVPASLAMAALAAMRSLLTAVAADRMGNTRHNSNAELLGLGLGNIIAPFFGGFIATGVIARSATNISSGARSFVAALLQAGFLLASMLYASRFVSYVPMASLAALLLRAACQMGEIQRWPAVLRRASTADKTVLIASWIATLRFGAATGLVCGILLAALLFCWAAAAHANLQIATRHDPQTKMALPEYVWVCDVQGPLYFGTFESCLAPLHNLAHRPSAQGGAVIIDLRQVPVLDASGVFGLKQAMQALNMRGILVVLVSPIPTRAVEAYTQAGWRQDIARSCTTAHRQEAILLATRHVAR